MHLLCCAAAGVNYGYNKLLSSCWTVPRTTRRGAGHTLSSVGRLCHGQWSQPANDLRLFGLCLGALWASDDWRVDKYFWNVSVVLDLVPVTDDSLFRGHLCISQTRSGRDECVECVQCLDAEGQAGEYRRKTAGNRYCARNSLYYGSVALVL